MAFGRLKVDELETSTQTVNVDALVGIAADGDKGDITVSGSGTVWSIDDGAVDTAALGGDITAAGKALLDDADAAAQRTTLGAEAAGTAASAISTHEAAADPHPGYALESSLATVATTGALGDLGDVDLTTTPPADGEALVYDSATGDWVPGATGGTPGGTTGQIQWNSSGSFAGVGGSTVGATGDITLSLAGAADTPPFRLTGTWFSGGTSTTTKPQFLIEPTGTTSTAWSTSGTGFGVNAPSGFTGNLLDLQVGGINAAKIDRVGNLSFAGSTTTAPATCGVGNWVGTLALFGPSGSLAATVSSSTLNLSSTHSLAISNDVFLTRDAADTFAQRRGTNAQTYRLYNTYTDASNYQRTSITDDSTGLVIDQQYAGTGAARTNLLDLQVDGTSEFKISNTGAVTASTLDITPVGTNSPASVGFGTAASSVLAGFVGANRVSFTSSVFGVGFILASDAGPIGFSSAVSTSPASVASSKDTVIYRDAAGILAQRNGTNAQTYRLYNTYTDASNYERAYLRWASNVLEIGTEGAGTGSEQPVRITAATLKLPNLPTYADNTAATSGGLVAGDVYKTATGELRITV